MAVLFCRVFPDEFLFARCLRLYNLFGPEGRWLSFKRKVVVSESRRVAPIARW